MKIQFKIMSSTNNLDLSSQFGSLRKFKTKYHKIFLLLFGFIPIMHIKLRSTECWRSFHAGKQGVQDWTWDLQPAKQNLSRTSEMIWQALYLAVLLAASAAKSKNLRKFSKNPSELLLFFASGVKAKSETNLTIRSAEAVRRWKLNRGMRALENASKNWTGDESRRAERSFSFRMCVAFELRMSSKTLATFWVKFRWWPWSDSSIAVGISDSWANLEI